MQHRSRNRAFEHDIAQWRHGSHLFLRHVQLQGSQSLSKFVARNPGFSLNPARGAQLIVGTKQ